MRALVGIEGFPTEPAGRRFERLDAELTGR
jgi:hypothetical protein